MKLKPLSKTGYSTRCIAYTAHRHNRSTPNHKQGTVHYGLFSDRTLPHMEACPSSKHNTNPTADSMQQPQGASTYLATGRHTAHATHTQTHQGGLTDRCQLQGYLPTTHSWGAVGGIWTVRRGNRSEHDHMLLQAACHLTTSVQPYQHRTKPQDEQEPVVGGYRLTSILCMLHCRVNNRTITLQLLPALHLVHQCTLHFSPQVPPKQALSLQQETTASHL